MSSRYGMLLTNKSDNKMLTLLCKCEMPSGNILEKYYLVACDAAYNW
jgi:hypothetical protein